MTQPQTPAQPRAEQSPPPEAVAADVTPPAEGGPAEVSKRGGKVVRLEDWTVSGFLATLGEGEEAQQVLVTAQGVKVNKDQAAAIKEQAAAHGVRVTEEDA